METTITVQGRAARRQSRRPHAAARRASTQPRGFRARVAGAFRQMAHGVGMHAAWDSTRAFYRSGGQAWSKQLG